MGFLVAILIPQQTWLCNAFNQIGTFDIIYINTQTHKIYNMHKQKKQSKY